MEMDHILSAHPQVCCRIDDEPLPVPDWYYLYRWGASPCHLSGVPDMQGLYDALGAAPAAAGRFTLSPHWRQDFTALAKSAATEWQAASRGPEDREDEGTQPARARRAGCDTTYKRGAAYLDGIGRVEDWGCGTAYFQRFMPPDCYSGIDLAPSVSATRTVDLATYT